MTSKVISAWHDIVATRNSVAMEGLLANDVVFHSPVVHTPQVGKKITTLYLTAASEVLFNESFRYVREIVGGREAALEFEVELDGILVNGVDLISWNEANRITDFKVLLRPLKGINIVKERMAAKLESLK